AGPQDYPGLLVLRPATATARLDGLKPAKGAVPMTVHTHRRTPPRKAALTGRSLVCPGGSRSCSPALRRRAPIFDLAQSSAGTGIEIGRQGALGEEFALRNL